MQHVVPAKAEVVRADASEHQVSAISFSHGLGVHKLVSPIVLSKARLIHQHLEIEKRRSELKGVEGSGATWRCSGRRVEMY